PLPPRLSSLPLHDALPISIILGAGLWLASRATSPLMFQLGFGVFVGVACGAFIAPMIAAVTAWFDTQRALAVSLVSAGMGMAPKIGRAHVCTPVTVAPRMS